LHIYKIESCVKNGYGIIFHGVKKVGLKNNAGFAKIAETVKGKIHLLQIIDNTMFIICRTFQ